MRRRAAGFHFSGLLLASTEQFDQNVYQCPSLLIHEERLVMPTFVQRELSSTDIAIVWASQVGAPLGIQQCKLVIFSASAQACMARSLRLETRAVDRFHLTNYSYSPGLD